MIHILEQLRQEQIPNGADYYNDLTVAYSLRQLNSWSNAILKLRRSSDSAVKFVFPDSGTITLSSLVGDTNTTPSATTLGTWVSTDDAFVEEWIGQVPDNVVDTGKIVSNATTTAQPKFISAGAIILRGGNACLLFDGSNDRLVGSTLTALDSGNDFSVFSVATVEVASANLVLFTNSTSGSSHMLWGMNTATFKRHHYIWKSPHAFANLTAQDTSFNQRLYSSVITSTTLNAYANNVAQDTSVDRTGLVYINNQFEMGSRSASSYLNGTIQEILIYPTDKSSDLSDINTDINTYYSVY